MSETQYPEHEKLKSISDKSQACGEFIDWLRDEPAQYFSARTISNFQVQKLFAEFPHVVKVRFPNEAADGQVDEIR